jgi:hypothetical protein
MKALPVYLISHHLIMAKEIQECHKKVRVKTEISNVEVSHL